MTTPALTSAFTKAKRRVDPMQLRMREEKKRKKLQKALKKLNKKPRIVRPVQELEVSPEVLKEATTTRYVLIIIPSLSRPGVLLHGPPCNLVSDLVLRSGICVKTESCSL